MTAAQRDWLLRTRVPIRSIRFHRFEATSSALARSLPRLSFCTSARHAIAIGAALGSFGWIPICAFMAAVWLPAVSLSAYLKHHAKQP